MKRGDFLSLRDLASRQVEELLDLALDLKVRRNRGLVSSELARKSIAMLFQKPSLRTRTSFDVGLSELGGHAVYLGPEEVAMGKRESIPDVARVLSRYVHGIVARTNRHEDQITLAKFASVPVINALSDYEHPCQAVADLVTMRECFGNLKALRVAYVGDGNNIARSLAFASAKVGLELTIASPADYVLDPAVVAYADVEARSRGGAVRLVRDPREAAKNADVLYTDVWTSMGQEAEAETRRINFAGYQVNQEILSLAQPGAIVMHDLPAHRGEEISEDVIDGPQSVVFQQAENRLHAQNAVLVWLLGDGRALG